MQFPRLRTSRLALDIIERADLSGVYRIYSDPEVMRFWSYAPWQSMEQAEAWYARIEGYHADGDTLQFVIKRLPDLDVVGLCTLFKIDTSNRRAEIGYAQARDAWGQGYMHEALTALVGYGFNQLGLHRIEADIDPLNVQSAASLGRLGFKKEGLLRERWYVNGQTSDSEMYGLLEDEWRARK
jgi:RimJ/RimL family protein N-acetyltransferase